MNDIAQDDASPQTNGELTSQLSPKRARTDCAWADDLSANGRFESRELEPEGLTSTAGCANFQDGKPPDQSQFTPLTDMATSHGNSAHAGSSELGFISTERHPVLQPPVTEEDQLCLYLTDGTGGSPPAANTPGLPDRKQLAKSPKDEAADSCSLSAGNEEDEEVRCQSDCTPKDAEHGPGLCNTRSQFAEVLETHQRREELDFSKAEGESPVSSRDYAEFKPLYSESEEDPSGNSTEGGKNEENKWDLQICENENIPICDRETKGQVNERKTFIPSAAECDEGSVLPYGLVSVRNIEAEEVSLEVNNEPDHEEPAEGDNDEDPFSVIDPAIRSEEGEEAEGMHCKPHAAAGKEKACEMEAQEASSADQAEGFDQPCRAQDEVHEVHCQSNLESQACSASKNETCNTDGDEGICQWKSSPLKPPPAGDGGTQESRDTEGHRLKEQSCFPVTNTQGECDKVEATAEMKEMKGGLCFLEKTEIDGEGENLDKDEEDASAVEQSEEETQKPTKLGDKVGCLRDHMCVTAEREERKEHINVPDVVEDDVQKQSESPSDWAERSRLAFCTGDDQEQSLSCFSDPPNRADTPVAENKDQLLAFTFPSTNDAVVPCQQNLINSQNAHDSSTALKSTNRFPPSAFTFCSRVLQGFDTFEKIQLLPDDEDYYEASGLGDMPVLTSFPTQLLKSQLHIPVVKSDDHMEIPEEEGEEVERSECHTENTTNGLVRMDLTCNEVPNFISPGGPELEPTCDFSDLTHNELKPQSEAPAAPSDGLSSEFEMKEEFDRVLKELNLFFEISRNDFPADCRSSLEQWSDAPPSCTEIPSSPKLGHHRDTATDKADQDLIMEICGGESGVSPTAVSSDGEQEVPLNRHPRWETSKNTAESLKEPREMQPKGKTWSPSFMCSPVLEQLSHRPPEQLRRLEPLKTCSRPIRVGLSRRARTNHLHRSHPYKQT